MYVSIWTKGAKPPSPATKETSHAAGPAKGLAEVTQLSVFLILVIFLLMHTISFSTSDTAITMTITSDRSSMVRLQVLHANNVAILLKDLLSQF